MLAIITLQLQLHLTGKVIVRNVILKNVNDRY